MSRRFGWCLSSMSLAIVILAIAACSESVPTVPTVTGIELAAGGVIKDPAIKSTVPDSGFQGDSLELKVVGSGFDEGSTIQLELNGDTTDVETLETLFVTSRELHARIKIVVEADTGLYDVAVRTSRDKKGIGSEMFRVQERVKNNGPAEWPEFVDLEVEILRDGQTHGYTDVTVFDDSLVAAKSDRLYMCGSGAAAYACIPTVENPFFGCPDGNRPCNAVRLTIRGDADKISFRTEPSVQGCRDGVDEPEGGCVYDETLEYRRNAASFYESTQPALPLARFTGTPALTENGDGTRTLRFYWQGQRYNRIDNDTQTLWSFYPDLDLAGGHDHFVFHMGVNIGDEWIGMATSAYADCDLSHPCWAEFKGDLGHRAYVVWDDFHLGGAKNKNFDPTHLEFALQTFASDPAGLPKLPDGGLDYLATAVEDANVWSWFTVMMTNPAGQRRIAFPGAGGINPDDPDKPEIHNTTFAVTFEESGCYEVHLLDSYSYDEDALDYVWYSTGDPDSRYLKVQFQQGGEISWHPGERCGTPTAQ